MRKLYFFLAAFILLLTSACKDKQLVYASQMEGVWNIAHEEIVIIHPDGSVADVSETENVGVLTLTAEEGDRVFRTYSLTLTNSTFSLSGLPFKADEELKRVFFYNFFCGDIFGCDWVGTIEVNEKNRQQWSFIRQIDNPNGADSHRKTTWTLSRQ
ncbi:MAG: hypothetical protein R3C61_09175 [Bacteroidia bacterium]